MKKVRSPECVLCLAPLEDRLHFALQYPALFNIRSQYINAFIDFCPNLIKHIPDKRTLLLTLLDPYSPLVPSDVRETWDNSDDLEITSMIYTRKGRK